MLDLRNFHDFIILRHSEVSGGMDGHLAGQPSPMKTVLLMSTTALAQTGAEGTERAYHQ